MRKRQKKVGEKREQQRRRECMKERTLGDRGRERVQERDREREKLQM